MAERWFQAVTLALDGQRSGMSRALLACGSLLHGILLSFGI